MKKFLPLALCMAALTALLCLPASAAPRSDFDVLVNGQPVAFTDAAPKLSDGRSYLPLVATFQALGFAEKDMVWNADTATVTASRGEVTLSLTNGQKQISIVQNGQVRTVETDAAPFIDPETSRTYVPFGLVADALGYRVGWDAANSVVIIDDVDAILAANQETYTLMNGYLAYGKQFNQQNYKVSGSYQMDMGLDVAAAGESAAMDYGVSGKYQMLIAGPTAFQFQSDMVMDMDIEENGANVNGQIPQDAQGKPQFPMTIDLDMRGDMAQGAVYIQSQALSELLDLGMENMWFKLDLAALTGQMGGALGMDYAALLGLVTSSLDMDFETYLDTMLRTAPLNSAQATTADMLALFNTMFADSAFEKSGSSYVSTVQQQGMEMTFTLYADSGKVSGYSIDLTAADPILGSRGHLYEGQQDAGRAGP